MMSRDKIQPEHVARPAFVYVRQSTLGQVRHHHESRRRQYGLAEDARALGWRDVTVIDEDLGKSGASAAGRVGFQRLVATVGLGQAGAIFGSEVSRLARNNRDWYQLLDLCGLLNTLIIDTEGIYDPRQDRAVIDVVRDLARSLPDGEIARILNRLGYQTGQQNSWTAARVASLRYGHQIPAVDRTASARLLTMVEAARALRVSPMTIRRLITGKVLPATQPVPYAPWAIHRDDLALAPVQRAAEAVKHGRRLPQPASGNQLTLGNSQT